MKKCPAGQYYCFTDKKCKKIPMGYHVGGRGMLEKDTEESEAKKNGNGNGNGNAISNGNGNGTNGGNGGGNGGGMGEQVVHEGGTLHKWFKGSKSKDGKGGWVNVVTGGTCASDKPGEGTPKCVSSAKRASMTKAERLSAARRKKKADPGQQQKSGAAKPTYVKTDSPREEMNNDNLELIQEKDRKGKGSGTKDACYHKVKSRYRVWPSAYASGALVKCRKVGAANWGNKSEGLSWDELTEKFRTQYGDKTKLSQSSERKSLGRKSSTKDGSKPTGYESPREFRDKSMPLRKHRERFGDLATEETSLDEKCWPGYEKKGMKTMFGKRYPNCVKKKATRKEQVEEATRLPATTGNIIDVNLVFRGRSYMLKMFFPKVGIPSRSDVMDQIEKVYPGAKLTFFRVSDYEPGQPIIKVTEHREREEEVAAINETSSVDSAAPGEFTEETEGTLTEKKYKNDPCWDSHKMEGMKKKGNKMVPNCVPREETIHEMEASLSPQEIALQKKKGQIDMQIIKKRNLALRKNADQMKKDEMAKEEAILEKTAAWTRKAGKNKEGGLNEKGRKSYERENPGSDLKAPSKKVGNKRRASFCARMKGMKKKLTSAKTANDPDSRINKSLRAWNC